MPIKSLALARSIDDMALLCDVRCRRNQRSVQRQAAGRGMSRPAQSAIAQRMAPQRAICKSLTSMPTSQVPCRIIAHAWPSRPAAPRCSDHVEQGAAVYAGKNCGSVSHAQDGTVGSGASVNSEKGDAFASQEWAGCRWSSVRTRIVTRLRSTGSSRECDRHFVREFLPALKFNNAEVAFVKKIAEPGPSKVLVELGAWRNIGRYGPRSYTHFACARCADGDKTVDVDVTNVHSRQILGDVLQALGQTAAPASSQTSSSA